MACEHTKKRIKVKCQHLLSAAAAQKAAGTSVGCRHRLVVSRSRCCLLPPHHSKKNQLLEVKRCPGFLPLLSEIIQAVRVRGGATAPITLLLFMLLSPPRRQRLQEAVVATSCTHPGKKWPRPPSLHGIPARHTHRHKHHNRPLGESRESITSNRSIP